MGQTLIIDRVVRATLRRARLVYSSDRDAGLRRVVIRKTVVVQSIRGRRIRSQRVLKRIAALVIPPAWTDVWICPDPRGHIQATGRDQRGRKQYIYHSSWREVRDQTKYDRLIDFAESLEPLRRHVDRDLRRPALDKRKVVAAIVRLLERTLIRVGNDEYARKNQSFGLTTLRDRHVKIRGSRVRFEFRGKSGIRHAIDLENRRLAPIIRACQELPGQDLFQFVGDDGATHRIRSDDVNEYLREVTHRDFTAKDFRTWAGTVLAAAALRDCECRDSETQAKRTIVNAVTCVAKRLGNTKTVCRQCYIHPAVFEAYRTGRLTEVVHRAAARKPRRLGRLSPDEIAVLQLLKSAQKVWGK